MDDLKAKLHKRGRVGIIHDPEEAVAWIEKNWEIPLLTSIRKHGYDGPFAQMLFMEKPALALFGSRADEFLRDSAEELGKLSKLPVVIRPSSDAPKGVLALPVARESSPGGSSVICYPDLSSHDGQRGATGMDVASEHRTRLALRMKTHNSHVHAVDIRSNFKFHIGRDTNLAAGRASLDHPSFESEVIALVDLQIETGLREIQVDRSYVSIGFLAHREESMMNCEFLHRDFDLSEKHRISTTLGFPAVEASHRKIMPKQGDMWDEDSKSYRSYNIAYEPQHMRLNPRRSEAHPLEVKVGMGINLQPPGSEKPLPQISFIHRNQILIWVPDPASKARVRGIVASMSNYLDDIRKEGQVITEPHDLHLMNAGTPYPGQGICPYMSHPREY
ncbi:hypothetical protein B0H13DRAFT_1992790 [Mycena leptocephala]|nr:hypothetical protein B0H13DRAFT_1992790 [Mycena leptocephala]